MLQLKSFEDIGGLDVGWLKAKHHFAIGPYGNPAHKAVGNLIVFNDDEIAPHTGFGLHPHENIEIVSCLREGTVTHFEMAEAAQILTEALGRPIAFAQTPIEQVRQYSKDTAVMLEWFERVGYSADIAGLEREFGRKLTKLPDWTRRHARPNGR